MPIVRYEFRRPTWLCFFDYELRGRTVRKRTGIAGDSPPFSKRPFKSWIVRPTSTLRGWYPQTFASVAEAKQDMAWELEELRKQGFVKTTLKRGNANERVVDLLFTEKLKREDEAKERARAREAKKPIRPALRPWKEWWDSLTPGWQAALRRSLHTISKEGPPTNVDLEAISKITHLMLNGADIKGDLRPIAKLKALEHVELYETHVRDLTPLSGLSKLEDLDLYGTGVTDLRPLARLKNLGWLRIANNSNLWDVRPLLKLPKLSELELYDTGIEDDLLPLKKMPFLYKLVVSQQSEAGQDIEKWSKILDCSVSTFS